VEASFPVLLTVVRELNEPRLPSLKGKMAAKKAEIKKWGSSDIMADEDDLGLKGSPTQVKNIFTPEARSGRRMLEGSPDEQVEALIQELRGSKCL
jgi:electron transfer flavoprotein beta subunit